MIGGYPPTKPVIGLVMATVEGGVMCQQEIVRHAARTQQPFPDIVTASLSKSALDLVSRALRSEDPMSAAPVFIEAIERVAAAGATVCAIPANLAHYAFDAIKPRAAVKLLSIVETVVAETQCLQLQRIGLLGTLPVMTGPLYRDALAEAGIEVVVPDPDDQQFVDDSIFSELVHGRADLLTREAFVEIVEKLRAKSIDGLLLCCTELGLVVEHEGDLPVLDSTKLLAHSLLRSSAAA